MLSLLDRPRPAIEYSDEALQTNLQSLEEEFETYKGTRERDAVYSYLTAVFELVSWWDHDRKASQYARRALWIRGHRPVSKKPEPFAAVILCTADVDFKIRSKWSRVLRYAVDRYDPDEPLVEFIKRKGGINRCVSRYACRLGRCRRT